MNQKLKFKNFDYNNKKSIAKHFRIKKNMEKFKNLSLYIHVYIFLNVLIDRFVRLNKKHL